MGILDIFKLRQYHGMTEADHVLFHILTPICYFRYIVKEMNINLADVHDPVEYYLEHLPEMRMPITYWVSYFDELPDGLVYLSGNINQIHTKSDHYQCQSDIDHPVLSDQSIDQAPDSGYMSCS